ncbi:probable proline--tRNA ligase, mitochondrial isoform X2 [Uranotaenia lowii]|uniref:probable proline--tRNA ligase, mitochondrial isoform X2 n=1 Tax=Uranotaenia lowii TaxID=190385 RepID=UPI00247AB810|nr:probable proline--tRNA ligase, mitochondrial isoform X2 [Uranotaenia lowii]
MIRLSKIFQPTLVKPKNAIVKNQDITSKSQRLLLEQGLVRQAGNGTFYMLPLLQRSLQKAIDLIDGFMQQHVEAQKLTLPILTSADLWRKSGRLDSATGELMTTNDRHDKLQILGPTHEESITALLAAISPVSYRQFPLRLYQISTKFRDEMKPRFGLLRAKEFIMKDLYTFDVGLAEARRTYEEVNEAYANIFNAIGVPFVRVSGDTGLMGGSMSHEYHFPSDVGEDQLVRCDECGMSCNHELFHTVKICEKCNHKNVVRQMGIEVGHAFILEDKYSKVLGAKFLNETGKPETLQMGCYGIGVSRLVAAGVEVLSTEKDIIWPFKLAPFKVCIIPPKVGSKEQEIGDRWLRTMYDALTTIPNLQPDIVVDDRPNMTIGKRLVDAKKTGFPIAVVIGPKAVRETNAIFEVHHLVKPSSSELFFSEAINEVRRICDNS